MGARPGHQPSEPSQRERTRAALREAALTRFVRDGFDATSVSAIAADAGVTPRTFYRYFASKDEVLFADYKARLDWFRRALSVRPRKESLVDSVRAAVDSFPDDPAVVSDGLDPDRIDAHIRRVEAELARAIEAHLVERTAPEGDERVRAAVAARAVAAAVFAALDAWMAGPADDLDELTRLTEVALTVLGPMSMGGAR
jgi:AcrR family transcriptional regulator